MNVIKKLHKDGIGQQGQIAGYAAIAIVALVVMFAG